MRKLFPVLVTSLLLGFGGSVLAQEEETDPILLKNPVFESGVDAAVNPIELSDSVAKTESEMKAYTEVLPSHVAGEKVSFKMVPIKGGTFTMGSPDSESGRNKDEGPAFETTVKPFWMEEHEVTWEEYQLFALHMLRDSHNANTAFKGTDRELKADALAKPTPPYDIGAISYNNAGKKEYPASGMTQYGAAMYCKWLTFQTGRYYRLPTEIEWEYACRAGSKTAYAFGDDAAQLGDYAWFLDNKEGEGYTKIMKKKPNAWGLYDMYGNVSEWVMDSYSKTAYKSFADGKVKTPFMTPKKKPTVFSMFGDVTRGGSVDSTADACRSAARDPSIKDWKIRDPMMPQSIWWVTDAPFVGFRIVRPLETPSAEDAALFEPDPKIWVKYIELNPKGEK